MSKLPVWWSSTDWTELEVPAAVWAHRDLCREHHVEPDTVVAVARGMAGFADTVTGRDCRPTNARLREVCRVSQSTIQRARRVLKELGLVVVVVRGRSVLTRTERLMAWGRGSSHRTIAACFALCSRGRKRRASSTALSTGTAPAVDRDHPPVGVREGALLTFSNTRLQRKAEMKRGAARPAHTEKSDGRGRSGPDPATRRLADGLRARLAWLSGISARRITPTLSKFARYAWTVRDVERAVAEVLTRRGHVVPRNLRQPAAFLANVLRDVDPADRPGAVDEWMAAEAAAARLAEQRWTWALRTSCAHGVPAGDVARPGHALACPLCRAASS